MRFKEDVRDEAGENLTERQVVPLGTTSADATPAEEDAYEVLADMREAAKRADEGEASPGRSNSLIQYGLYKHFLSSPEACRSTVEKRLEKLSDERTRTPRDPLPRATAAKPLEHLSLQRIQPLRPPQAAA